MTAGKHNITIEQGSTWTMTLTLYEDEAKTTPLDLTGYTARMQIRSFKESSTILDEFTTENGGITISGANSNIMTITASATDTEAYSFRTGVYDLEIVLSGVVARIMEGDVEVSFEVTR